MTGLLAKHPDVQGVLAYNDASAIGAAAAARAQGKKLAIYGNYGGASDGLNAIESGQIRATVAADLPGLAKYAIWGAYHLVDQVDLPFPAPFLQHLLPFDRGRDVIISLEPHQPENGILLGKAFGKSFLMLINTANQIVRDTNVDRPVLAACQDVDPVHLRRL